MQGATNEKYHDKNIFETILPKKDYNNVEKVVEYLYHNHNQFVLSKKEMNDIKEYIKGMNGEEFDKLHNAKLLSKIRLIMLSVGWEECSNITIRGSDGKEIKGNKRK